MFLCILFQYPQEILAHYHGYWLAGICTLDMFKFVMLLQLKHVTLINACVGTMHSIVIVLKVELHVCIKILEYFTLNAHTYWPSSVIQ